MFERLRSMFVGAVVITQAGGQQQGSVGAVVNPNSLSLVPTPLIARGIPQGTLQRLSSSDDPGSEADHLRDQAGDGEVSNSSFPGDPTLAYLGINITDTSGGTVTFVLGNLPAGCAPTVNGTHVDDIRFNTQAAECDDDPNATVGLLHLGNESTYLTRPDAESVDDSLYHCNVTGPDGREPPHLVRMHVFTVAATCTASPTAGPTVPAQKPLPSPAAPFPWKTVLKAGGAVLAFCALALCGCCLHRRNQRRQVAQEPQARPAQIEMVDVNAQRSAANDGASPVRVITISANG